MFERHQLCTGHVDQSWILYTSSQISIAPNSVTNILSFIKDTKRMKFYFAENKVEKLKFCTNELLNVTTITFEGLSRVMGFFIFCLSAFPCGKLHYRGLELQKIENLCRVTYKTKISLTYTAQSDLQRWSLMLTCQVAR